MPMAQDGKSLKYKAEEGMKDRFDEIIQICQDIEIDWQIEKRLNNDTD